MTTSASLPRSAIPIVIATVFIDVIGFGMVLPLLPSYAARLGGTPGNIGLLVASYSAIQFVLAPLWGRVSDRIGRRPVLLIGLAGSVASYLVFAFANSLPLLLLSRVLDGGSGATVNVAQAYLADETTPEQRTKAMGMVGAAFGLGFIVGPILGGITAAIGNTLPGIIAAIITAINLIMAWRVLPESIPAAVAANAPAARTPWRALAAPVAVLFLATLAFSVMYVVFPLFGELRFKASRSVVSYWFAYVGLATAIVQGGLLGRLVTRLGEVGVARLGAGVMAVGFLLIPPAGAVGAPGPLFYTALALLGAGFGMAGPAMIGLASRRAAATVQGRTLGVTQSASSLARIIGPIVAGAVMQAASAEGAFRLSAAMAAGALLLAATLFPRERQTATP
ncbi:MAG: MFS transporter [Gemmatimonadetes bacterium]|jgi:multidrug resistance protein|nr:MFS transporter [Gemmatimonadota bacterium]MBK9548684.1 MFS transporter [Gemmatimonadota bacterium]MBP6444552.1 MFS transporter [Gemmatimonadales bacterium]MBP6571877.1 MFS transporter [Gemmatimonadales bacterium]MBP7621560.1 MFS transporter [Gemmatimonadales bacterium]